MRSRVGTLQVDISECIMRDINGKPMREEILHHPISHPPKVETEKEN